MCLILWMSLVLCDRLLRLKLKDGLYVTNSGGTLSLKPATPSNLPNQKVVIHKRVLYFFRDGTYYTLAMVQGGVDIKLIVYNAMNERDIGFMTTPTLEPHRRKVNPFAHLAQKNEKAQNGEQSERSIRRPPRTSPDPKPAEEKTLRKRKAEYSFARRSEGGNGDRDGKRELRARTRAVLDSTIQNKRRPDDSNAVLGGVPEDGDGVHLAKPTDVDDASRQAGIVDRRLRESHLIESDSKIDDHEFGYVIKNVKVSEIDSEHFRLVAKGDACVTYYKDGFVFMPCSSAAEQVFRLEALKEAVDVNKPREQEDTPSGAYGDPLLDLNVYDEADKDIGYRGAYEQLLHPRSLKGSTDPDSGPKENIQQNRYVEPVAARANVKYKPRNANIKISTYAGRSIQPQMKSRALKAPGDAVQGRKPGQEGGRSSLDYDRTAGPQKLNGLNDDFIYKFRDTITDEGLNDFI